MITTTETGEFERIAALTIKANEAVIEEMENDGDSHTFVLATMGVFQPEIDRLKAEVERLRSAMRQAIHLSESVSAARAEETLYAALGEVTV